MKAMVYNKYGSVNNFSMKEVNKPEPGPNDVLIKVHASSINSWDWDLVRGKPYIYRLIFGFLKPKYPIIGIDVAGTIVAIGSKVSRLKVGDEVFADVSDSGFGAFAEFVVTREELTAHKPKNASFEQAAALPHGGVLALQSINYNGPLKTDQKILINGAGGSTGTIAIQLAKLVGVKVTCVDTEDKFELLKSIGADYLLDYTKVDYTKLKQKYDLIIDLVAHKSVFNYKNVVAKNGAFTVVGGAVKRLIQIAFIGAVITKFTTKKIGLLMHKPCSQNLDLLRKIYEEGKIEAIIDKVYTLPELPQALQRIGDCTAKGKIVIKIQD